MDVQTINGIVHVDLPSGYDPVEASRHQYIGYLRYKGFVAGYEHGLESDGEAGIYFGSTTNLRNTGFVMQGDTLPELRKEFEEMVDEFLEEIDDPSNRYSIEYYTSDPDILSYYHSLPREPLALAS